VTLFIEGPKIGKNSDHTEDLTKSKNKFDLDDKIYRKQESRDVMCTKKKKTTFAEHKMLQSQCHMPLPMLQRRLPWK